MLLISVGMTGNDWKWIKIVAKGCIRAIYCSTGQKWLEITKMAENRLETGGDKIEFLEILDKKKLC